MTFPNTNNARRRSSWIAILLDKLCLGFRFRSTKRFSLALGLVALMMGANSAFAQTQTCAILTGGVAGQGIGVSPPYLANQDGRANEGCRSEEHTSELQS